MRWPWQPNDRERETEVSNRSTAANTEIEPPWIVYPSVGEPWNGGWRQGLPESWLINVWMPFWKQQVRETRVAYVDKWMAPDEWRFYLMMEWSDSAVCIPGTTGKNSLSGSSCTGLQLAVFGVNAELRHMRWFVALRQNHLGFNYSSFWVHIDDFDQFISEFHRCQSTKIGSAVLFSRGEDTFRLEIEPCAETGDFELRYSFIVWLTIDKGRYKHTLCGGFSLDVTAMQRAKENLISMRVDPEKIKLMYDNSIQ